MRGEDDVWVCELNFNLAVEFFYVGLKPLIKLK